MHLIRRFILLIPAILLAACANSPTVYSFQSESTPQADVALVQVQRGFSGPVVLLARVDGVDPLKHKAMEGYKPLGLERYEPRLIGLAPGVHTLVVQFQLTDLLGKLVTDEITSESAKKYPIPDHKTAYGDVDFATLLHSEKISFDAQIGGHYFLKYKWSKEAKEISIYVEKCAKDWLNCVPYQFESTNAETKFILGMGRRAE